MVNINEKDGHKQIIDKWKTLYFVYVIIFHFSVDYGILNAANDTHRITLSPCHDIYSICVIYLGIQQTYVQSSYVNNVTVLV